MSPGNGDKDPSFSFTPDNLERAHQAIARYPEGRQQSAVLALLDLAQRQNGGWLPLAALDYVADFLDMPRIRVYEVGTFYSMLNLEPVGRYLVQVCRTTSCWLRGYEDILETARAVLGIDVGETTEDGLFTLVEVECLCACCNAPVVQINDDYYEDLDRDSMTRVLEALRRGERPTPGSQIGRRSSEPITGLTTLTTTQTTREA